MPNLAAVVCPHCGTEFEPKRRDQKYCSANCRKRSHQKKDREANPRTSFHSPDVRRTNLEQIDRMMILTEDFYTTKPDQRISFLREIVERAREGEKTLRAILANRYFLGATFGETPRLYFRKCWAYPNVTKEANRYCRNTWGASVIDVVMNRVPEPETDRNDDDGAVAPEVGPPAPKSVLHIVIRKPNAVQMTATYRPPHRDAGYMSVPLGELKRRLRLIPEYRRLLSEFDRPEAA